MGLLNNGSGCNHCGSHKCECKERSNCKGCGCGTLSQLPIGTAVSVTVGGTNVTTSNLFFAGYNPLTCCGFFADPISDTRADIIVIDCETIQAIRIIRNPIP